MPGLSVIWAPGSPESVQTARWTRATVAPTGGPEYRSRTWIERDELLVGLNSYPGYPTATIEKDGISYLVEGEVFPASGSVEDFCTEVGSALLGARAGAEGVRRTLRSTDGDFIVVAFEPATGRLALTTDVLGRLPLYRLSAPKCDIVSRDISTILRYSRSPRLDGRGVTEYLTFGYSLGRRTIFDGVRRLAPATYLRYEPGKREPAETTWFVFDFEEEKRNRRSLQDNAAALAARFRAAAARRSTPGTVVSLSGGLDSRAVAAALKSESAGGRRVKAATYMDPQGRATADARVASRIAECLDLEWRLYRLPRHGEEHLRDLGEIKAGLNSLVMAFILPFFEALLAENGPTFDYVTGDGGDKVLPSLSPSRPIRTLDEMVDLIIEKEGVLSPEAAEFLSGSPEGTLVESIRERIASYPERDLSSQYVHFLVYERAVRLNFEGEDRNRYYFWSSTPFFAVPVVEYAFECPEEQKAYYRLYGEFLRDLSADVAQIERPAFGGAITDRCHRVLRMVQDLIGRFPVVEELIDRIRTNGSPPLDEQHPVHDALEAVSRGDGGSVDLLLDTERLRTALDDGRLTERQGNVVWSLIEGSATGAKQPSREDPRILNSERIH